MGNDRTYRIGVVGTFGGWSSEKLADAVARRTGYRLLIDLKDVRADLTEGKVWFNDVDLSTLDALLIKKVGARYSPHLLDRLEILRYLHGRGVKMFSDPARIMRVLDRLSCTVTMKLADIPMPPTVITEDVQGATAAVEAFGEAVFKPLYSTKARGMVVMRKGPGLREEIERFKEENQILYIQQKIDHRGQDLGITFLGGKYLTTYARCQSDASIWNTTTPNGGKYKPCHPREEIISLAQKAQAPFGLDFTCVDVALTREGPMVFEVSAFGGFRGVETAAGIDVAGLMVDYALKRLQRIP